MFFQTRETKTKGTVLSGLRSIYSPEPGSANKQERVFCVPVSEIAGAANDWDQALRLGEEHGMTASEVLQLQEKLKKLLWDEHYSKSLETLRTAPQALKEISKVVRLTALDEKLAVDIYGQIDAITKALKARGYKRNECVRKFNEKAGAK